MLSAENPMKVTQALIDAEVTECPALAPYYAAAQRLGKIVIVDEKNGYLPPAPSKWKEKRIQTTACMRCKRDIPRDSNYCCYCSLPIKE